MLVAEVVCGELARAMSLPVPALVTVDVAAELAVGEPDQEVQELLQRSAGVNLGLDYLPGALDFEAGVATVDPSLAGRVLWFDALVGNVDRSWRNPNMLFWHGRLQLIDHGATLTFHHHWPGAPAAVARPYDATQHALVGNVDRSWRNPNMLFWHGRLQLIDHGAALTFHHHWPGAEAAVARPYDASAHALLECEPDVPAADAALAPRVTRPLLEKVLAQVPDEWLEDDDPDALRVRYVDQLLARLEARDAWLPGLVAAAEAGGGGRRRGPIGANRPAWLGPPPPEGVTQR